MRLGDAFLPWPKTHQTKLFRAQLSGKWGGRKAVSFADECDEVELQRAVVGWQEAENATMRIDDAIIGLSNVSAVIVDNQGWARVQQNPTRAERKGAHRIVSADTAKGTKTAERKYPLLDKIPITEPLSEPKEIPENLRKKVEDNLKTWEDCFPLAAREKLEKGMKKAAATYKSAVDSEKQLVFGEKQVPLTPKQIESRCRSRVNIKWLPQDMSETVQDVFAAGFTLDCPMDSPPQIHVPKMSKREDWGFDNLLLAQDAEAIKYADREIISILRWGAIDYSSSSPPISMFVGSHPQALQMPSVFTSQIAKEIANGWITGPVPRPITLPFQIGTGSLVLKRCQTKWRLTWNSSFPRPTQKEGMFEHGLIKGPVSTNFNTLMDQVLKFRWASAHSNDIALEIVADAAKARGCVVIGTSADLKSWFRMCALNSAELGKHHVQWAGEIRVDLRLQMGRASAAHTAHRISKLFQTLCIKEAINRGIGTNQARVDPPLASWIERRKQLFPNDIAQQMPWYIGLFQDDLNLFAAGHDIARELLQCVQDVAKRYGIELSDKEEATRPFSQRFEALGVQYDARDANRIARRPTDYNIQKLTEVLATVTDNANKPTDRNEYEKAIGRLVFASQFIPFGEILCNSLFVCLATDPYRTHDKVMVTQEAASDAQTIYNATVGKVTRPLSKQPSVCFLGQQALACDASGQDGAGWGICYKGILCWGTWPTLFRSALDKEAISISHAELAVSGMAMVLRSKHKKESTQLPIVVQNDNTAAVDAINRGRARNHAFAIVLKEVANSAAKTKDSFVAAHLQGEENTIADNLSRGKIAEAKTLSLKRFNRAEVAQLPQEAAPILEALQRAARQAIRAKERRESIERNKDAAPPKKSAAAPPKKQRTEND